MEITLTFAVAANAMTMLESTFSLVMEPSGLSEATLGIVELEESDPGTASTRVDADLAKLRKLPEVAAASRIGAMTFGPDVVDSVLPSQLAPPSAAVSASHFEGGPGEIGALGLELVAGREFRPEEYVDSSDDPTASPGSAIVTEALATRLFGTTSAIGKSVYTEAGESRTIVGIVRRLLRPHPVPNAGPGNHYSMLLPVIPSSAHALLAIRTRHEISPGTLSRISKSLATNGHEHAFTSTREFRSYRANRFQSELEDARLLATATLALVLVTAVGIYGLAGFRVRQRSRDLAIRRALGATKPRIIGELLAENSIILLAGIFAGTAIALALNQLLMVRFELSRLGIDALGASAILVLSLGQFAVLGPGIRAASIDPLIALKGS